MQVAERRAQGARPHVDDAGVAEARASRLAEELRCARDAVQTARRLVADTELRLQRMLADNIRLSEASEKDRRDLEIVTTRIARLESGWRALQDETALHRDQGRRKIAENAAGWAQAQAHYDAVVNSRSWRLFAPARWLASRFRRAPQVGPAPKE